MQWYYVDDGKQAGTVNDAQLEALVGAGKVTPDTLVWRQGMENWQPYAQVSGQAITAEAPPPQATCSQCGRPFPPEEMIRHGSAWICAECKPVFLQKLKEGVSGSGPVDPTALGQEIAAGDYNVDVGSCLSRSWELLKGSFWPIAGGTALVYVVMFAAGAIPYAGSVIQLVVNGPLMGGLYWYLLKAVRGEDINISDAFSGFGPNFTKLMLAHIVSSVLLGLCILPGAICILLVMFGLIGGSGGQHEAFAQAFGHMGVLLIPCIALLVVGFLAIVYLSVCWVFMFPLIMDKQLNFWPAMKLSRQVVGKHWWTIFLLLFVGGLIAGLGVLACCVGVFVTMAIFFGAMVYAYEDIFGNRVGTST
jgi:hypothetical protein